MLGFSQSLEQLRKTCRRDARAGSRIDLTNALGDGTYRPGAAHGALPTATQEQRLHGLELQPRGQSRPLDALAREAALREIALAHGYASHLQALELQGLMALADDELGTAPADVDHQPTPRLGGQVMGHTGVDQPRLLD